MRPVWILLGVFALAGCGSAPPAATVAPLPTNTSVPTHASVGDFLSAFNAQYGFPTHQDGYTTLYTVSAGVTITIDGNGILLDEQVIQFTIDFQNADPSTWPGSGMSVITQTMLPADAQLVSDTPGTDVHTGTPNDTRVYHSNLLATELPASDLDSTPGTFEVQCVGIVANPSETAATLGTCSVWTMD